MGLAWRWNLATPPRLAAEPTAPGWHRARQILTGADELAIIAEVQHNGWVALKLSLIKPANKYFDHLSREYKQEFLAAILYNMTSGMSAGKALQSIIESETGAIRERLDLSMRVISRGGTFSEAVAAAGFFDDTTLAIIDAGERTGSTRQAIETAIEHYKSWSAGMKAVLGLAGFVAFDFFTAFTTVIGVRWQLLPMLAESGIKTEDPEKQQAFQDGIANAYLMNDVLFYLAVICMLMVFAAMPILIADNPAPKKWLKHQLNKVPFLADALRHSAVATSMKVASSLLCGGVSFFKALAIVQRGSKHEDVEAYWSLVTRRVEGGIPVGRAMKTALLDGTEQVSIAAHSNQQQLGQILERMSVRRAAQGQKAAKKFTYLAIGVTMLYILASIGVALWVMKIQNSALTAGL